jgi:hypothetical protein
MRDDAEADCQCQWDRPEGNGVAARDEHFEGREVVLETFFLESKRDLQPECGNVIRWNARTYWNCLVPTLSL